MGSGLSVVGKVKEGLKLQKSITEVIGKGYKSVGEVTVPIKNTELLNKLNITPKGDWVKVYEAGIHDGIIKSKVIGSGLEAVFKEVYELLEEMEDKSGSTRWVGEGKNKPDLDKVTEQEVKRYWIPDPKNTKDSIRVTESEYGVDYRKPINNGINSRSWSVPTDKGGN